MKGNKRGISTLVAYVLLIGMSIAIAGAVYAWLHFYVLSPLPTEKCPDEVSIIIYDYSCSRGILNLTIQNRGNFNISGYVVKFNNDTTGIAGKYPLCESGTSGPLCGIIHIEPPLAPAKTDKVRQFDYNNINKYKSIKIIEIEPFRGWKNNLPEALCDKAIVTQRFEDC